LPLITTTHGVLEARTLLKHEQRIDTAVESTLTVEYCLSDCDGQAHRSGRPDMPYFFCAKHIYRGCHVQLKQGLEMFGIAAKLG